MVDNPQMKNAIIAAAIALVGGYYIAMNHVGDKMCKDSAFATNIAKITAKCPNISTYELIKYYEGI